MFKVTQLLSYQVTAIEELGRPSFGAKSKGWRLKVFFVFQSLQSDISFGVKNPFSRLFNAVSSERRSPTSIIVQLTTGQ